MERLMTIRSFGAYPLYKALVEIAEARTTDLKLKLAPPVVVLGDASSSMNVAIRTSSILASILCKLCKAELRIFRHYDEKLEPPNTVQEVVEQSQTCQAGGSTAPAASLIPYYLSRTPVRTFIIVTDEEENTSVSKTEETNDASRHGGWGHGDKDKISFAPLFREYVETISPDTQLVFISFTETGRDGQMVRHLKDLMPTYGEKIRVFKLDRCRPDLTKLDRILAQLSE